MSFQEQSDLEKATNESHDTSYQDAVRYKENAFIKNCKCGLFSLVFAIKPEGSMTEIFSVGLQTTDKGMKAN